VTGQPDDSGHPKSPRANHNLTNRNLSLRLRSPRLLGNAMYEVMIEEEFSAAHALRGYRGKCENLHGHNWKVEIYVRGERLDDIGMLVDFTHLKKVTRDVMRLLDHQNLNEIKPFDVELNPSSEHLAGFILDKVANQINDGRVQVYKVRVWETPSTSATYQPAP